MSGHDLAPDQIWSGESKQRVRVARKGGTLGWAEDRHDAGHAVTFCEAVSKLSAIASLSAADAPKETEPLNEDDLLAGGPAASYQIRIE